MEKFKLINKTRYDVAFKNHKSTKKLKPNRKVLNRTVWKNWRIIAYARYRYYHCNVAMHKHVQKFQKKGEIIKEWTCVKIGKKSFSVYPKAKDKFPGFLGPEDLINSFIYKKKPFPKEIERFPKKIETIRLIIKMKDYWIKRNLYNPKKPVEDMNKPKNVHDEIAEYNKSVCHYLETKKEYNQDFFIKNDNVCKEWKDPHVWEFFLKIK